MLVQRLVDNALAVTKESVKALTYELLNHIVRLINGVSANLLALLPGNTSILEGMHGWELRPTFRGPKLPRWMENGVSSFNQIIHDHCVDFDGSNGSSTPSSHRTANMDSPRRLQTLKYHVFERATNRRRGVVEDLHLATEIFIEFIFDFFHKAAYCLLAPLDTFRIVFGWFSFGSSGLENYPSEGPGTSVTTATLSEINPTLIERKTTFCHSLDTDARTCQDVITELGYPYEAIRVVTSDGYVLLLERIPRRDARKVVYLQHGVLDSSMGYSFFFLFFFF